MQIKELFEEDNAVSPVIGVILMVAITVILAAVIATFVLGLGEQVSDTAPQISFNFDYEPVESGDEDFQGNEYNTGDTTDSTIDGILTIQHAGGPNTETNLLGAAGTTAEDGSNNVIDYSDFSDAFAGEMTAGDRVRVFLASDDTISITWQSPDGTTSSTLQRFEGPDVLPVRTN